MTKWVVLSCTPNSAYDFFLPIAVRLWRKIGYEPIVVLVGPEKEWAAGHAKAALDATLAITTLFGSIPGIPDAAVAMALRQQVSALAFDDDDVILIGDVDLFPVDREFYHRYDPSKNPVGVYYAETYGDQYWPAYGVSMPVRNWREVMGVKVGDFRGSVESVFTDENVRAVGLANEIGAWDTRFWTFDERYASYKIKTSRFSKDVALFPSSTGNKQIRRLKLPCEPYASDYVDFHCSRPGWTLENWPDLRFALAQMIPEDLRWLDGYVETYWRTLTDDPTGEEATPLPWAGDIFGEKVGTLKAEGYLPRPRAVAQDNQGKVDVVFVKADGWHEPRGVLALDYTYDMEFSGNVPEVASPVIVCRPPRPAHVAIAREAFRGTRFYRDPFLAGRAATFFERWLSGDGILYALETLPDEGFLFVSVDPDGAPRVSLLAVAEKSRGSCVGRTLAFGVIHHHRHLMAWRVRVNARNPRAIRFYENLGFRTKSVQTAFHVWPNGDQREEA